MFLYSRCVRYALNFGRYREVQPLIRRISRIAGEIMTWPDSIRSEKGIDTNRPPVRILSPDGCRPARQPSPQIDSPGELSNVTLLVPKSVASSRPRCCHRPSKESDVDQDTYCNQEGDYEEWSLEEIETDSHVRRCKMCFQVGFDDTLTPIGVYTPETRVTTCSNCGADVSGWQLDAHQQVCAKNPDLPASHRV
jgi:hypothetical protein